MRVISPEELELIAGAQYMTTPTTSLPPITVTAPPYFPPNTPPDTGPPQVPPVTSPPGGGTGPGAPGNGPPTCLQSQLVGITVDRGVIDSHEGKLYTTGYTLNPTLFPQSGVTIGTGVDLGYRTVSEMTAYGVSSSGLAVLSPYLGLRGNAAVNYASAHGLPTISGDDAAALSNGIYNAIQTQLIGNYNAANTIGVPFNQLPSAIQTTLMDIAYNSPNIASAAPTFWTQMTTGRYEDAVNNLLHWYGDGSTDRRHTDDANILLNGIYSGQVPTNVTTGRC